MAKKKQKVRQDIVPIDSIHPNTWNPNEMRDRVYKFLVEEIRSRGMRSGILVTEDGTIIDGEHRWKAAKELGYKEIPVFIVDDDPLSAMLSTVNMNLIKGEFNAIKYGQLISELGKSYSTDDLAGLMITEKDDIEMMQNIVKSMKEGVSEEELRKIMAVGKKGSKQYTLSFANDEDFEVFRTTINSVKSDEGFDTTEEAIVFLCHYYIDNVGGSK